MVHDKAQRRLLFCAAFFSFGTLGGARTLMMLSDASVAAITGKWSKLFAGNSMLRLPAAIMLPAALMTLCCASARGSSLTAVLLYFSGFLSGAVMDASVRIAYHPVLMAVFLILYALCMIQIGASLLHLSAGSRFRLRSSGRFRPDRSFDWKLAASASAVLLLASIALTIYLMRS